MDLYQQHFSVSAMDCDWLLNDKWPLPCSPPDLPSFLLQDAPASSSSSASSDSMTTATALATEWSSSLNLGSSVHCSQPAIAPERESSGCKRKEEEAYFASGETKRQRSTPVSVAPSDSGESDWDTVCLSLAAVSPSLASQGDEQGCCLEASSTPNALLCEEEFLEDEALAAMASPSDSHKSDQDWEGSHCQDISSPEDIELSPPSTNPLPEGYFPVDPASPAAVRAAYYSFTPTAISVGTSYFCRIAAKDGALLRAALRSDQFCQMVAGITAPPRHPGAQSVGAPLHSRSPQRWCMAVWLTCVYLATKMIEHVPYKNLLQTMLSDVHYAEVTAQQTADLEVEVLLALEWRLGPYFLNDSERC